MKTLEELQAVRETYHKQLNLRRRTTPVPASSSPWIPVGLQAGQNRFCGVFVALGVAGSTALARKIGAEVDGNRIVVDEKMQTTVPGLYAVGRLHRRPSAGGKGRV